MTRHPFDPSEIDLTDPELEAIAERLDRFATDASGDAPSDLSARIRAAVDVQPAPRRSIIALIASWGQPARSLAAAAVVVLAVTGVVAVAQFANQLSQQVGATPPPSVIVSPSPSPSPSVTPSPSPSPTPTPTASPSSSPTRTALPTSSDDDPGATPDPGETPDPEETPEPSESDNSGPGGGGGGDGSGGNSGPGGGD